MSTTPPNDAVGALVDNQKKIYAQIVALEANYSAYGVPSSVTSKLQDARSLAIEGTVPGAAGDVDLLLKLHLVVLAGPSYIQQLSLSDSHPERAQLSLSIGFRVTLLLMDNEVKKQWKHGPQKGTFDFEWKVAYAAYVLHTLHIQRDASSESGDDKGPALSEHFKKRQPFERFLETRMQAASDSEKTEWIKACDDLYAAEALRNRLPESFKDAKTVFDKAKVLHQAWLDKLGVPAPSSKAWRLFGRN